MMTDSQPITFGQLVEQMKWSVPGGGKHGEVVGAICEAMDPDRGSQCYRAPGHTGDHKSLAGYPFENLPHDERTYPLPSVDDIEAVKELLGETGWTKDVTVTRDLRAEPRPCMLHEACDMEPCTNPAGPVAPEDEEWPF